MTFSEELTQIMKLLMMQFHPRFYYSPFVQLKYGGKRT